jgi:hypothetical protein
MKLLVDRFDTSIKSLEASQQYKVDDKIKNFKMLIEQYFNLYSAWLDMPTIQKGEEVLSAVKAKKNIGLNAHRNFIKDKLATAPLTPETLRPSARVNVMAITLGSKTLLERGASPVIHLEDVFSVIHQSLLAETSYLSAQANKTVEVPPLVVALQEEIQKEVSASTRLSQETQATRFMLIGMAFTPQEVIYYYNLPLRNHSAVAQLAYNLKTKSALLTVEFMGESRDRWPFIDLAVLVSQKLGFTLSSQLDVARGKVVLTWPLSSPSQVSLQKIHSFIQLCVDVSYGEFGTYKNLLGTRFAQTFQDMVEQQQLYKNETFQAAICSFFSNAFTDLDEDKMIAAAVFGMQSSNESTISKARSLFFNLIQGDKGIKEAIAVASAGAKSPSDYVRSSAFELFGALIGYKQQGIKEALVAASANMQNPKADVRYAALMLLSNIVAKGQGIKEAIAAASANMQSPSEEDRYAVLKIFKALVEKGQSMKEALAAAVADMKTENSSAALEVFGALVEKGEGIHEAIAAASASIKGETYGVGEEYGVLAVFTALVAKGKGFDEAATAILSLIQTNPDYAEKLFNAMRADPATKPQLKKLQQELQAVKPANEASKKAIEKILAVQL